MFKKKKIFNLTSALYKHLQIFNHVKLILKTITIDLTDYSLIKPELNDINKHTKILVNIYTTKDEKPS